MTDVSLKFLSTEMKISVKSLIKKLSDIGIFKNEFSFLNKKEYDFLKKHLDNEKKISQKTLILKRKIRTTLNVSTLGGKNKAVQIEVRKQKTYIKNDKTDKEISKNKDVHIKPEMTKNKKDIKKFHNYNNSVNIEKNNMYLQSRIIDIPNKIQKNKNVLNKNKSESYVDVIHVKKNTKFNKENWTANKTEKKDYHLTTFLHARQAEDDNDQAVEIDNKNRNRNIKSYRSKKNSNQYYDSKHNKDDSRFHFRSKKKYKNKNKSVLLQQAFRKPKTIINRDIIINETITVSDLANKMATKSTEVIKTMMNMGIIGNINQTIDQDTAQLIAEDRGHKVILQNENALEEKIMKDRDTGNNISIVRAPVVTIMGHVDHGKTSLLDYIRSTQITTREAGGITQHIGAYDVKTRFGSITFLDTPGHSAFTAMRSRGVKITDIVVLVVAADDGVMPQTIEAIQHAKEANVPIIVAINKIDKIESDIDKVKNDLMKYEVISEEWGGQNIFVSISAKTGKGVDQLLNSILLQSEMLELKAIFTGMAEGVVIESSLDKGRGPISTVLVTKGCLKKGDVILCGCEYGRVKTLRNDLGDTINSAEPSTPVEILGLSKVSHAGDIITVVRNEKQAKELAFHRQNKSREIKLSTQNRSSLENMFENIKKYNHSELKLILKSDVQGSLEAISGALLQLSTAEVKINIISLGIGGVTETDASLALASNAIILGFNVRADSSAKKIIISENLDLRYYSVIYTLIDEVKLAMTGLLSPEYKQKITGLANVRNIFKTPKFGSIAGCMVIEGVIKRNSPVHILRNNVVIYEGELESLRRFKEDVNEVRNGMECGIAIKNYNDIRVNDSIESFEVKEIKRMT